IYLRIRTFHMSSLLSDPGDLLLMVLPQITARIARLRLRRPITRNIGATTRKVVTPNQAEQNCQRRQQPIINDSEHDNTNHVPYRPSDSHGSHIEGPYYLGKYQPWEGN